MILTSTKSAVWINSAIYAVCFLTFAWASSGLLDTERQVSAWGFVFVLMAGVSMVLVRPRAAVDFIVQSALAALGGILSWLAVSSSIAKLVAGKNVGFSFGDNDMLYLMVYFVCVPLMLTYKVYKSVMFVDNGGLDDEK